MSLVWLGTEIPDLAFYQDLLNIVCIPSLPLSMPLTPKEIIWGWEVMPLLADSRLPSPPSHLMTRCFRAWLGIMVPLGSHWTL